MKVAFRLMSLTCLLLVLMPVLFEVKAGEWFILRSEDGSYYSVPFGAPGDQPQVGDFDGDGKTDKTVFRQSNGNWYIQGSTAGLMTAIFGTDRDRAMSGAFVR